MKYRYTLEVLTYDGRILHRAIEADDVFIKEGSIAFKIDAGDRWNTLAVYPADKTIITKIEKLK
jgi:hypothetical protein